MISRVLLLLLLVFQLTSQTLAITKHSLQHDDPFSLLPDALLAHRNPQFEGDSVEILKQCRHVTLNENGSKVVRFHRIYRLISRAALDSWGEVYATYDPWYQDKPEIRVRIITPEGDEVWLDPGNLVEEATSSHTTHYQTTKQIRGPLPGVARGSVVEELITTIDRQSFYEAGVAGKSPFVAYQPTEVLCDSYDVPETDHVNLSIEGASHYPVPDYQRERYGDRIRHSLTAFDVLPQHFPLSGETVNYFPVVPRVPVVAYSTGGSWQAIANSYLQATQGQSQSLKTISIDSSEPIDIIRRAYDFVRNRVRYTAYDLRRQPLIPDAAPDVLERAFGDCKDKSFLLINILSMHGVEAKLALLSTRGNLEPSGEHPGMGIFNHAIVYIPNHDLWLDPTSIHADMTHLPLVNQHRWALIVDKDTQSLVRTPTLRSEWTNDIELSFRAFDFASLKW